MKIQSLQLRNFKGVRDFSLALDGAGAVVKGDNGTGKTTLADSVSWLLWDKDSHNQKDFSVKTLGPDGQPVHYLDHEVEGVLLLEDGRRLTLKKVFAEKWVGKKGSPTKTFSGHETSYFIDEVPVKKAEYDAKIAGIAREDLFKLLTNPTYFSETMHWTDRRRIILEACGDLTDAEVIASDKELAALPAVLDDRDIESHKKVVKARTEAINKELREIPARIDEATRALPDITGVDPAALPGDIAKLQAQLDERRAAYLAIQSGGAVADKRVARGNLEAEIQGMRNEHAARESEHTSATRRQLSDAQGYVLTFRSELDQLRSRILRIADQAMAVESEIAKKRQQWFDVNDQVFEYSAETVCPTCNRELPEEQVSAAREKALARFNEEKAERLAAISAAGKALKGELEALMAENSRLVTRVNELEPRLAGAENNVKRLQAEIQAPGAQQPSLLNDPKFAAKMKQREKLEAEILRLQTDAHEATIAANQEIESMDQAIKGLQAMQLKIESRASGVRRIDTLKAQEKLLAAEYEKLQGQLYLIEQFTRAKVSLLEERINSKFRFARFKMFNPLINGGLEECCETLYEGVPYGSNLNSGHRIIVGLDIIRTLADHFGFHPPIFVDNAESVTDLPDTGNTQVIRLVKPEITSRADREVYSRLVVEAGQENHVMEEAV